MSFFPKSSLLAPMGADGIPVPSAPSRPWFVGSNRLCRRSDKLVDGHPIGRRHPLGRGVGQGMLPQLQRPKVPFRKAQACRGPGEIQASTAPALGKGAFRSIHSSRKKTERLWGVAVSRAVLWLLNTPSGGRC